MSKILDRDHYVDVIGVLDWMYDENKDQKLRFDKKGVFEYKKNNKLHRFNGPAIEYYNGGGEYFLEGKKVSWEYHVNNKRFVIIDGILVEEDKKLHTT